jgi:wyosine [tRNA(Phe)-imidazoG37] synthetase (radical SAM superfamily)
MSFSIKRFVVRLVPFRHLIRRKMELLFINGRNILKGKAFYCNSLAGRSDYNICINSDMTVSCHCFTTDGSSHIGDLNSHTLEEIFKGETASKFRKRLSRGIIPINACLSCRELKSVPRADAKTYLSNFTTPKRGIMVENTALCNLSCLNCGRKELFKSRKKMRMSLPEMERAAANIQSCNVRLISFFNFGEPFLSDTIFEEITLLKKYNPEPAIYVSTNGLLINNEAKFEAALLVDYIYVSLDGATDESVTKYQVGGCFTVAYDNMKKLIRLRNSRNRTRPVIEWKYVVFSWNDSEAEIERAVELARDAGVDILAFYLGEGPPAHVSSRFKNDEFFKALGRESWKGRELDFRKERLSSGG